MKDNLENKRILKFFPADKNNLNILSSKQIDNFNLNGYISPLNVFSYEEITRISEYFDELISKAREKGHDDYAINGWHRYCSGIYNIMMNPIILDYVSDLIGNNILNLMTHLFFKDSKSEKQVCWHQDASYWPLTPSKTITIWLAIDDVNEQNGAMQFVSGSHLFGQIPFSNSKDHENNVLNQTVHNPEKWGKETVNNSLKAGQISIHSDLLLHGSKVNNSTMRRRGLTLRYMPPDVKINNLDFFKRKKAFLCKGENVGKYWDIDDIPCGENIPDVN